MQDINQRTANIGLAKVGLKKAISVGMTEKARELLSSGAEIYQENLREGAKDHH